MFNFKTAWKLWSVRFDFVMYAVLGYFLANPTALTDLVSALPAKTQQPVGIFVAIILFGAKTSSRLAAQPNLKKDDCQA